MPGRHQLIYAYPNYQGGTDLWCSGGWWPAGQWFYVWRTAKPIGLWHATRKWTAMGWRFAPNVPWAELSDVQRRYTDVQLSRQEATVWPPPALYADGHKGFSKGGYGGYDQAV